MQRKTDKAWITAHERLLQNIKEQAFVPRSNSVANVVVGGRKVFLPAYVPYIGKNYFAYRPRVFCYAINQNLSDHAPWTEELLCRWGSNLALARDRLNRAARKGEMIPIKPYAEGFIPLVALIAIQSWIQRAGGRLPKVIDDVLAVTNFIKFSTSKDAADSSIPKSWWRECGRRYAVLEIEVLRPDIIIGFGNRVFNELEKVVRTHSPTDYKPRLLKARFPTRIASFKGKPLSPKEAKVWNLLIRPLIERIKQPQSSARHAWKIEKFPGYFVGTARTWKPVYDQFSLEEYSNAER